MIERGNCSEKNSLSFSFSFQFLPPHFPGLKSIQWNQNTWTILKPCLVFKSIVIKEWFQIILKFNIPPNNYSNSGIWLNFGRLSRVFSKKNLLCQEQNRQIYNALFYWDCYLNLMSWQGVGMGANLRQLTGIISFSLILYFA